MDVTLLKQFKKGDQVDIGLLLPGVDDAEVRWTCTNVVDGTRITDGKHEKFRMAEFTLDYFGVSLGDVRAYEKKDGGVSWESMS